MNACCPLIEVSTINSFIEEFISSNASGLFSVVEHKRFFYRGDSSIIDDFHGSEEAKITFNTKFVEPLYSAAPLRAGILKDIGNHKYMGTFESPADPPLWKVNAIEATDVDYEEEFLLPFLQLSRHFHLIINLVQLKAKPLVHQEIHQS